MKKTFIFLVMTAFVLVGNVVRVQAMGSPECDRVFDFENAGTYTGNNVTANCVTNPYKSGINTTNNVLNVTISNGYSNNMVIFPITLPDGKKFSEVYTTIKLQLASSTSIGCCKEVYIGVSDNGTNWTAENPGSGIGINSTWQEVTFLMSSRIAGIKDKTGTFYLGLGVREGGSVTYFMDNVVLVAASNYDCHPVNPLEDATLKTLTVTPGTLTPAFSSAVTSYTVNVPYETKSVTIAATATQAGAIVSGDGVKNGLIVGNNPFTVYVTSEDENHFEEYEIIVKRAAKVIDCDLKFTFETGNQYSGSNIMTVNRIANPNKSGINTSEYVLHATHPSSSASTSLVYFQIKLPDGKTFSETYTTLKFQLAQANSTLSGKDTYIAISDNGTSWTQARIGLSTQINTTWHERSIDLNSFVALYETASNAPIIKNKTGTFYLGLGIYPDNNSQYYIDNIVLLATPGICVVSPKTYTWNGSVDSDWETAANWTPNGVPSEIDAAIIPSSATYPVVPPYTEIETITFLPGAEITNQHNLIGNYKAYVQYDFSSSAARDRWHMISIPLQEAYVGDFTFGGHPRTFFQTFGATGWEDSNTFTNDQSLSAGDSFLFGVEDDTYTAGATKGLGSASGILEIPFFEKDNVIDTGVHPNHEYSGSTSTFYNYKKVGSVYENGSTALTAARNAAVAYKLADTPVAEPLVFAHDDEYNSDFALVGNPFMSTIDFDLLHADNSSAIKQNYQIWTGAGFVGYTTNGCFGTILDTEISPADQYIAPLQSFFVEKDAGAADLVFNIAASATGEGTLKSAKTTSNKLEIIATNPSASVLAFVADRENGQEMVGSEDAGKLFIGASEIPEVYTLKERANETLAPLGANIIHSDNMVIPVGLFTTYNGNMSLIFKGMNDYNAQITLIDHVEGDLAINLTDLPQYQYDFDFTPLMSGDEYLPVDNRFSIQLAPKVPTGLDTPSASGVKVYLKNKQIHVLAGLDKIQQVAVYNVQGMLLQLNQSLNTSSATMDCSANLPAVYIVKVVTNQGVKNFKVINN